ncbi:MAG: hypothetical protein IJD45_04035 [Clostridia bacterium]|nr:hypothetical protein [Clostridia bacterium]
MQRFLCWDNFQIETSDNITVFQHTPQKANVALACNDEWDGVHNAYAQVIKVDDGYRMYYRAWGQNGFVFKDDSITDRSFICVAESKDGKEFTKINVGKYEFNGSKANNIVFYRDNGRNMDTFTIYYDQNPACKPEEKYKALVRDQETDILDYYISADGFNFEYVERIAVNGTFDSFNVVFWSEEEKQYLLYFRGFHHPDGSLANGIEDVNETTDIRDIRLAVSKDFRKWEFVDFLDIDGIPNNTQLYTNQVVNYYRKLGTFIGFPMRYCDRAPEKANFKKMAYAKEREGIIERYGRGGTAISDTGIMLSHDGVNFILSKTSFVKPDYDSGMDWWYGGNFPCYGLIETASDMDGAPNEISFYIGKGYRVKKVDFCRYTIRLDGFFSWFAGNDSSTVITKPFILENSKLNINFASSASGGLQIEILDKNGTAIEGYNSGILFGNSVNREIDFQKRLSDLIGQEIKIKFTLQDCHLYSYTFE